MIPSKKGFEISLEMAIKLIMAFAFVLFITYVGMKFGFLFSSQQDNDAAINNFNRLVAEIETLKGEPYAYNTQPLDFFLPDTFILVGFDAKPSGQSQAAPIITQCTKENIEEVRSEICKEKACLCLYKDFGGVERKGIINVEIGNDFDSNKEKPKPVLCHKFDERIIFLAPYDGEANEFGGWKSPWIPRYPGYSGEKEYEMLVFYGSKCTSGSDTGIVSLYIDRYRDGDNEYVYMTGSSGTSKARRDSFLPK
ncbi:hypothetical protein HY638_00235 [Candidatus Woesearchaeota archaeon]|nr:hypothetical protein [Candidatus Woesearchaeota archaeon]